MASADQLDQWKAMGGKVEGGAAKKGTKKEASSIFIAPSGMSPSAWMTFECKRRDLNSCMVRR